jgi:hypothetical protein
MHGFEWQILVLIAQARIEDLALVSNETLFDDCHVRRGW